MIDPAALKSAHQQLREELLAQRVPQGHWVGELSTSALSTATAVSALSLVDRGAGQPQWTGLIEGGIGWLAAHQNSDGGWGDTDRSLSNIATTMLAQAAFRLAGAEPQHAERLARSQQYVAGQGGLAGLRRRYGIDKTFVIPILTNCALAGLVPWSEVDPLPFELACLPQSWYRLARMPVVSYAIPALVAIGQARYFHGRPWNPLLGALRSVCVAPSLRVLERMQPDSGGYLEATPLTSFVVMSLAGTGRPRHPVAQAGVRFLADSVRPDGSWPIDTNLAAWVTTLSVNALAAGDEPVAQLDCWPWLLGCQHLVRHPFTGADPGGWGWSDLSGAVPDADDTPGALLALAHWWKSAATPARNELHDAVRRAALGGLAWLLQLQNRDGGWPTFCRGWGKLPFDRSGTDLTAHVLRALAVWRPELTAMQAGSMTEAIHRATRRGLAFLAATQRPDGSWLPLWFGNQWRPDESNPVYGTARVLLAYADLGNWNEPVAQRGVKWLAAHQNADGGWGGRAATENPKTEGGTQSNGRHSNEGVFVEGSSIEETAVAVEALYASDVLARMDQAVVRCRQSGLAWLVRQVEAGRHRRASPIGFYFARLWYYERLYPLVFALAALGRARRGLAGSKALEIPHLPTPPAEEKT